jgi:hypothetical protein
MNIKHRKLLNAAIGFALLFATGCWNKVTFEDEQGYDDYVILPNGYSVEPPAIIKQTESNITVTIIYKRRTK